VQVFIDPRDVPADIKISMWLRMVWVCKVVAMNPFVILEELIGHHVDVCFHCCWISGFDGIEIFIEDDMILGTDKLGPWVEYESYVASMMLRLANIDAHVASSA
jgi:hypothetical protein